MTGYNAYSIASLKNGGFAVTGGQGDLIGPNQQLWVGVFAPETTSSSSSSSTAYLIILVIVLLLITSVVLTIIYLRKKKENSSLLGITEKQLALKCLKRTKFIVRLCIK